MAYGQWYSLLPPSFCRFGGLVIRTFLYHFCGSGALGGRAGVRAASEAGGVRETQHWDTHFST